MSFESNSRHTRLLAKILISGQLALPLAGCGSSNQSSAFIVSPAPSNVNEQQPDTTSLASLSLSRTSGLPGELLTITPATAISPSVRAQAAARFDPDAATFVVFENQSGYRVAVKLDRVDADTIRLPIPLYFENEGFGVFDYEEGTVSVSVEQRRGNERVVFGPVPLTIGATPEVEGPAGELSIQRISELIGQMKQLETDMAVLDSDSRWVGATTRPRSELASAAVGLELLVAEIRRLAAGEVNELNIGNVGGQEAILKQDDLRLLDVLFSLYYPREARVDVELNVARESVLRAVLDGHLNSANNQTSRTEEIRPLANVVVGAIGVFLVVQIVPRIARAVGYDTLEVPGPRETLQNTRDWLRNLFAVALDATAGGQAVASDFISPNGEVDLTFSHLLQPAATPAGQGLSQVRTGLANIGLRAQEAQTLIEFLQTPPLLRRGLSGLWSGTRLVTGGPNGPVTGLEGFHLQDNNGVLTGVWGLQQIPVVGTHNRSTGAVDISFVSPSTFPFFVTPESYPDPVPNPNPSTIYMYRWIGQATPELNSVSGIVLTTVTQQGNTNNGQATFQISRASP